jgi:hypothetical protein
MRICNNTFATNENHSDFNSIDSLLLANLIAIKGINANDDTQLRLYLRPGADINSPYLNLQINIPNGGLFDNEKWNIAFGCQRNDSIESIVSSSYFLKVSQQSEGNVVYFQTTSSWFLENPNDELNLFREKISSNDNNFLSFGNNQIFTSDNFLNAFNNEIIATSFDGMISNLRFWSKALTDDEFKEHTRNYKSTGVNNPLINYNFVTSESGSFEKLRLNSITKQEIKNSDNIGNIQFLDFSENNMHLSGSGFSSDDRIMRGELFDYSYMSPAFDEYASDEKVRIRSFFDQKLIDANPWSSLAPVHEIAQSERPVDDLRMSIEFSLVDALNRDIITLLSSFDFIENAIGSPELIYSPDYPDLAKLREVYFNRVKDKLNFQGFFEFFRWFEQSIGRFIEQLIPRKTQFKGTNYVIESHLLERNKVEYPVPEIYLAESDRNRLRDVLLFQQITGNLRKY